jgi:hypothetical protein
VTFASLFEEQPEEVRPGLIRAHTFLTYGKRFDNLYLQESRLTRRYSTLLKQLCDIRVQRQAEENERQATARAAASKLNGFEFSTSSKTRPERSFGSLSPAEKAELERARSLAKHTPSAA